MGNHFHLLVRMLPETEFSDEDIRQRFGSYAGNSDMVPTDEDIFRFRVKWASVSDFTREIKVELARYYNKPLIYRWLVENYAENINPVGKRP